MKIKKECQGRHLNKLIILKSFYTRLIGKNTAGSIMNKRRVVTWSAPVSSSPQAAYYFRHFIRAVNAECNKHSIKRTHLTSIRMWNNMDTLPSTEVLTSWILWQTLRLLKETFFSHHMKSQAVNKSFFAEERKGSYTTFYSMWYNLSTTIWLQTFPLVQFINNDTYNIQMIHNLR